MSQQSLLFAAAPPCAASITVAMLVAVALTLAPMLIWSPVAPLATNV